MFGLKRSDGYRVTKESPLRLLMPYLMPGRNESAVYFEQNIDVTNVLEYLQKHKEKNTETNITFFHIFLACVVQAISQWPKMNRFIVGGKLYQRKKVSISFAVKKKMDKDAGMTAVKVEFEPNDTIFDVVAKVNEKIGVGRGEKKTTSEKEMSLIRYLPGFAIRFLLWLQRFLDGLNLLPASMIKNDPLYASAFVGNLGSLKINAPFHHLYEYGTTPLFGTIGRIHKEAVVNAAGEIVVRDMVLMRWTYDERIQDGFYAARGLGVLEKYMENPVLLEKIVPFN